MIEKLHETGLLSPLDVRFARFLAGISGDGSQEFSLAAALVSRYRSDGHVCIDLSGLAGKALSGQESASPLPELSGWIEALRKSPAVGKPGDFRPLVLDGTRLYMYRYWDYEEKLAACLRARAKGLLEVDEKALKKGFSRLFPKGEGGKDMQRIAAFAALVKRFCVISGGPGTGKTFTAAKILALLLEQAGPLRIALAAPTGKAAARLQESVLNARGGLDCSQAVREALPEEAFTIHRLLGSRPDSPYFRHDAANPLPVDVVVVDEASMVDLALLSKLVQALPADSRLILLGDRDQLASVEAGAVLGDICDTGRLHGFSEEFSEACRRATGEFVEGTDGTASGIQDCIVQLEKSYRFGAESGIGAVSRAVNENEGDRALELMKKNVSGDISWSDLPARDALADKLRGHVLKGFSAYLKAGDPAAMFEAFNRFRVLCALREGPYGVRTINALVENILRHERLVRREGVWYPKRPVMVTKNDYNLRLYNGDVGIVLEDGGKPRVFFPSADGGFRKFPPLRLPDHETVFAMTVHKSQGSEFDEILLVLPDRDAPVLTRELVYTGFTRAKERVSVWGDEGLFLRALSRRIERSSGLRATLWA
ncbi:MAG: exodeoxyribonuclease V subunit alpha [Syntrophobacterales bacterium]|nr:exodeoxyribonuclease V subunit alpha [Syntrophobacterales bacterium]